MLDATMAALVENDCRVLDGLAPRDVLELANDFLLTAPCDDADRKVWPRRDECDAAHRQRREAGAVVHHEAHGDVLVMWFRKGRLHREAGPALVRYDSEGRRLSETWYKKGSPRRSIEHHRSRPAPAGTAVGVGVAQADTMGRDTFRPASSG